MDVDYDTASMDDSDDCADLDDYYDDCDLDVHIECGSSMESEEAEFECLSMFDVERFFNESVASVVDKTGTTPSHARMLLHSLAWEVAMVVTSITEDPSGSQPIDKRQPSFGSKECAVCANDDCMDMESLTCGHFFCRNCWRHHFEARLSEGVAAGISCMEETCKANCPTEFVSSILDRAHLRAKYERFVFRDYVSSHPELRFCVGKDCSIVIRSNEQKAKRVTCNKCQSTYCVLCGVDYHAPTDCDTIRQWLIKCADDSETANYISAHTKDCPQCHTCIEKNGGCNHMQCAKCKHHFCWMCFGDWKTHGSEYYECSRYKFQENPSVAAEANHVKARRALEKYLHYYERFENHHKSLRMEEQLREKIRKKIDARVNEHDGTWIDWQYLHNAVSLLTRCRYTLQYTYPFAYFMETGPRKQLFEYQQAQLEKEVEELAWAVERADGTARGALEAHMHRAEHRRSCLLHDFFFSPATHIDLRT